MSETKGQNVWVATTVYREEPEDVGATVWHSLEAATEAVIADVLADNNEDLDEGEDPMDEQYVNENCLWMLDPEDPQAGFVYRDAPAFWDVQIVVTRTEVK